MEADKTMVAKLAKLRWRRKLRSVRHLSASRPGLGALAASRAVRFALAASMVCSAPASSAPADAETCLVENPAKVGVGAVARYGNAQMQRDLNTIGAPWYYDWQVYPAIDAAGYVPMIWSAWFMNYAEVAPGKTLLTFNEPDSPSQANMSVETALSYWPRLMATGKRLGSPAVTTGQEIGANSWLGRFMAEADKRGYRVDFIAVHYYTTNQSPYAFKRYLQRIHAAYQRPIWVTEWALADWSDPGRFPEWRQRRFFREASVYLDDLPFVERHAWFGLYDGGGGWSLNSGMVQEDGSTTDIGETFSLMQKC